MMSHSIEDRLIDWFLAGRVGCSSRAMVAVLTDRSGLVKWKDHPRDFGDFGRCLGLLDLIPEWRERLEDMKVASPEWRALVQNWTDLKSLYEAGEERRFWVLIKEVIEGAAS